MLLHVYSHQPNPSAPSLIEIQSAGTPLEFAIAPRSAFADGQGGIPLDRRRWARPGIYCLLGAPATPWPLYVGSSADLLSRLVSHLDHELDWQRAVLACLPGMSSAEAEQIEGRLVRELRRNATGDNPVIDLRTQRAPTELGDDSPRAPDVRALMLGLELVLQFGGLSVSLDVTA